MVDEEKEEDDMGGQAFDAPRGTVFYFDPDDVKIIGIDLPKENADGSQHFLYDSRIKLPLPEAFILNVMALGVKKPVIVTKVGEDAIVVDGRQRVRAAREAKKRLAAMGEPAIFRVPIILQKGEEDLLLKISVSTNEFSAVDSQLDKARKAQKLLDRKLTEEEVAATFGVSRTTLYNWKRVLGLAAPVLKAVENGLIAPSAAAELSGLSPEDQQAKLKELVVGDHKPAAQDVREKVRRSGGAKTNPTPGKKVLTFIVDKGVEEFSISEDFILGIKFSRGELENLEAIDGLKDAVEKAHTAPAKKRGRKPRS